MSYSRENFIDGGLMSSLRAKLFTETWVPGDEFDAGEQNTRWLKAQFERFSPATPVRVYIPEGRYYLGLAERDPASSEQMADLLVPAYVTLVFGPKATLVPLAYTDADILSRGLRDQTWIDTRNGQLPNSESLRVRIEIQGRIEADLDKIFDPFLEDDRDPMGRPSTVVPTRRGGTVFFTRDNLRAVYPEWWGAVPKRGDDGVLSQAEVRRTTVALQSCFDAVLHHRIKQPVSSMGLDRAGNRVPTGSRPSTEVIFANDYEIDRPIRIGMTLARARVPTNGRFMGDEYPFHDIGVSIRGLCGPAKGRNGAALLKASSYFPRAFDARLPADPIRDVLPEDPVPGQGRSSLFGDSYSLMIVRTFAPVSIENVVFDGNDLAQRCLTVMSFIPSTHHHALEGCTFRNALYAQFYVGGEVATALTYDSSVGEVATVVGRYFSGGQDLGDMRVSRCLFETGDGAGLELPRPPFRKPMPDDTSPPVVLPPGRWRHGVVYRSEPGLGTEFHGCVFRGRASPMVLAVGGRLSFQDCLFDTDEVLDNPTPSPSTRPDHVALRGWNGTDLYLAAGFGEYLSPDGSPPVVRMVERMGRHELIILSTIQPVQQTMLTARNVVSRSRQFLSTHPDIVGARATNFLSYASVTLLHVRHRSRFPDARPAIYWGAPRINNCALVMDGCVFDTEAPPESVRGSVFISPINVPEAGVPDLSPILVIASRRGEGVRPLLTCNPAGSAAAGVACIPNVMLIAADPR